MATHRPRVPDSIKSTLLEQAGRKCANPGCPNTLLELHHIKEWHIYQTHDAEHMIAICAACHDSVDRGELQISDETLYRWKGIDRTHSPRLGHIYVEPGKAPKLLLGSIAVKGDSGVVVFAFSEKQKLSFAVRDGEIMLLNVEISDSDGNLLLDVVDGHVRKQHHSIGLRTRPGAVEVPADFDSPLIPGWVRAALLREDEGYRGQPLPLLMLEVVDRGTVRVEGVWLDTYHAVVITSKRLSFVTRGRPKPFTLFGDGEDSILDWQGPLSTSMFDFASRP